MKRFLSLFLALCMMLSLAPASVLADEGEVYVEQTAVEAAEAPQEVITETEPVAETVPVEEAAAPEAAPEAAEENPSGETQEEPAQQPEEQAAESGETAPVPEEAGHVHDYIISGFTDPTCTEDGAEIYTCACGASYSEPIPASGHEFENGVCLWCGAEDPDYAAEEPAEEIPEVSEELAEAAEELAEEIKEETEEIKETEEVPEETPEETEVYFMFYPPQVLLDEGFSFAVYQLPAETAAEEVAEEAAEPVTEEAAEEAVEPAAEPVAEEAAAEETAAPAAEETVEEAAEPVAAEAAEAAAEPAAEEVAEAATEPVAAEAVEAAAEPVAAEAVETATEPVAAEATEETAEPATEEKAEPAAEEAVEAAAEPAEESTEFAEEPAAEETSDGETAEEQPAEEETVILRAAVPENGTPVYGTVDYENGIITYTLADGGFYGYSCVFNNEVKTDTFTAAPGYSADFTFEYDAADEITEEVAAMLSNAADLRSAIAMFNQYGSEYSCYEVNNYEELNAEDGAEVTIPGGMTVKIPENCTLAVGTGVTLTVNGTVEINNELNLGNNSSLNIAGTLNVKANGRIECWNDGAVITVSGTLNINDYGKINLFGTGKLEVSGSGKVNFADNAEAFCSPEATVDGSCKGNFCCQKIVGQQGQTVTLNADEITAFYADNTGFNYSEIKVEQCCNVIFSASASSNTVALNGNQGVFVEEGAALTVAAGLTVSLSNGAWINMSDPHDPYAAGKLINNGVINIGKDSWMNFSKVDLVNSTGTFNIQESQDIQVNTKQEFLFAIYNNFSYIKICSDLNLSEDEIGGGITVRSGICIDMQANLTVNGSLVLNENARINLAEKDVKLTVTKDMHLCAASMDLNGENTSVEAGELEFYNGGIYINGKAATLTVNGDMTANGEYFNLCINGESSKCLVKKTVEGCGGNFNIDISGYSSELTVKANLCAGYNGNVNINGENAGLYVDGTFYNYNWFGINNYCTVKVGGYNPVVYSEGDYKGNAGLLVERTETEGGTGAYISGIDNKYFGRMCRVQTLDQTVLNNVYAENKNLGYRYLEVQLEKSITLTSEITVLGNMQLRIDGNWENKYNENDEYWYSEYVPATLTIGQGGRLIVPGHFGVGSDNGYGCSVKMDGGKLFLYQCSFDDAATLILTENAEKEDVCIFEGDIGGSWCNIPDSVRNASSKTYELQLDANNTDSSPWILPRGGNVYTYSPKITSTATYRVSCGSAGSSIGVGVFDSDGELYHQDNGNTSEVVTLYAGQYLKIAVYANDDTTPVAITVEPWTVVEDYIEVKTAADFITAAKDGKYSQIDVTEYITVTAADLTTAGITDGTVKIFSGVNVNFYGPVTIDTDVKLVIEGNVYCYNALTATNGTVQLNQSGTLIIKTGNNDGEFIYGTGHFINTAGGTYILENYVTVTTEEDLPESGSDVRIRIAGDVKLNSDYVCCGLIVGNGASLTVNAGKTLTVVNGTLTLNPDAVLTNNGTVNLGNASLEMKEYSYFCNEGVFGLSGSTVRGNGNATFLNGSSSENVYFCLRRSDVQFYGAYREDSQGTVIINESPEDSNWDFISNENIDVSITCQSMEDAVSALNNYSGWNFRNVSVTVCDSDDGTVTSAVVTGDVAIPENTTLEFAMSEGVTIDSSASLTIPSGAQLVVSCQLTNNGTLYINGSGNTLQFREYMGQGMTPKLINNGTFFDYYRYSEEQLMSKYITNKGTIVTSGSSEQTAATEAELRARAVPGNNVTLTADITITKDLRLIDCRVYLNGHKLTVGDGATLYINRGSDNYTTIEITNTSGGCLTVEGTGKIVNNGQITVDQYNSIVLPYNSYSCDSDVTGGINMIVHKMANLTNVWEDCIKITPVSYRYAFRNQNVVPVISVYSAEEMETLTTDPDYYGSYREINIVPRSTTGEFVIDRDITVGNNTYISVQTYNNNDVSTITIPNGNTLRIESSAYFNNAAIDISGALEMGEYSHISANGEINILNQDMANWKGEEYPEIWYGQLNMNEQNAWLEGGATVTVDGEFNLTGYNSGLNLNAVIVDEQGMGFTIGQWGENRNCNANIGTLTNAGGVSVEDNCNLNVGTLNNNGGLISVCGGTINASVFNNAGEADFTGATGLYCGTYNKIKDNSYVWIYYHYIDCSNICIDNQYVGILLTPNGDDWQVTPEDVNGALNRISNDGYFGYEIRANGPNFLAPGEYTVPEGSYLTLLAYYSDSGENPIVIPEDCVINCYGNLRLFSNILCKGRINVYGTLQESQWGIVTFEGEDAGLYLYNNSEEQMQTTDGSTGATYDPESKVYKSHALNLGENTLYSGSDRFTFTAAENGIYIFKPSGDGFSGINVGSEVSQGNLICYLTANEPKTVRVYSNNGYGKEISLTITKVEAQTITLADKTDTAANKYTFADAAKLANDNPNTSYCGNVTQNLTLSENVELPDNLYVNVGAKLTIDTGKYLKVCGGTQIESSAVVEISDKATLWLGGETDQELNVLGSINKAADSKFKVDDNWTVIVRKDTPAEARAAVDSLSADEKKYVTMAWNYVRPTSENLNEVLAWAETYGYISADFSFKPADDTHSATAPIQLSGSVELPENVYLGIGCSEQRMEVLSIAEGGSFTVNGSIQFYNAEVTIAKNAAMTVNGEIKAYFSDDENINKIANEGTFAIYTSHRDIGSRTYDNPNGYSYDSLKISGEGKTYDIYYDTDLASLKATIREAVNDPDGYYHNIIDKNVNITDELTLPENMEIQIVNGATLTISKPFTNNGTMIVDNGTLQIDSEFIHSWDFYVNSNGSVAVGDAGSFVMGYTGNQTGYVAYMEVNGGSVDFNGKLNVTADKSEIWVNRNCYSTLAEAKKAVKNYGSAKINYIWDVNVSNRKEFEACSAYFDDYDTLDICINNVTVGIPKWDSVPANVCLVIGDGGTVYTESNQNVLMQGVVVFEGGQLNNYGSFTLDNSTGGGIIIFRKDYSSFNNYCDVNLGANSRIIIRGDATCGHIYDFGTLTADSTCSVEENIEYTLNIGGFGTLEKAIAEANQYSFIDAILVQKDTTFTGTATLEKENGFIAVHKPDQVDTAPTLTIAEGAQLNLRNESTLRVCENTILDVKGVINANHAGIDNYGTVNLSGKFTGTYSGVRNNTGATVNFAEGSKYELNELKDNGGTVTGADKILRYVGIRAEDAEYYDEEATYTLKVGENDVQLIAEVFPIPFESNQGVTWTTGDSGIATVTGNGIVHAVKGGTTTVTATAEKAGIGSATAEIKAIDQALTVSATPETIVKGKTANITVEGAQTGATISYKSSDEEVATVTAKGVVTGKKAGKATITVTASGAEDIAYATGSVEITVTEPLSGYTLTLDQTTMTYTGEELKPAVKVASKTVTLSEGTDYTVEYTNNTNAGTATVTVTGNGVYSGTLSKTFKISKADQTLTVSAPAGSENKLETGSELQLEVSGNKTAVTFESSAKAVATVSAEGVVTGVKIGTAKITVKAAADTNYNAASATITLTVTENLSGYEVTVTPESMVYTGSELKPTVKVTKGKVTLKENKDYTLAFTDNIVIGTATVTVTGIGSYTGTNSATFEITKAERNMKVTISKTALELGEAVPLQLSGQLGEGTLTFESTDTGIASVENREGTLYVIANGTGEATITFTVAESDNYREETKEITVNVTVFTAAVTGKTELRSKEKATYKLTFTPAGTKKSPSDTGVKWELGEGEEKFATLKASGLSATVTVVDSLTLGGAQTIHLIARPNNEFIEDVKLEIALYPTTAAVSIEDEEGKTVTGTTTLVNLSDLEEGESFKFSAQTEPEDTVGEIVWTSSDKSGTFGTYTDNGDGTVTAVLNKNAAKFGTVTLTATDKISKKKAVVKLETTSISTGIKLYQNGSEITGNYSIGSGNSLTFKAELQGNPKDKTVLWTIPEKYSAFATVSNGTVKALDVSEQQNITLIASAKDGGAVSEPVNISIIPKSTAVQLSTEEEILGKEYTVYLNEYEEDPQKVLTISADVFPNDASQKVKWSGTNTKYGSFIADDNELKITGFTGNTGTITLTAQSTDKGAKKASVKLTFARHADNIKLLDSKGKELGDTLTVNGKGNYTFKYSLVSEKGYTVTDKNVLWSLSGEGAAYASIANGKLKVNSFASDSAEPVTVTVTAALKADPTISTSYEVTLKPNLTAGIDIQVNGSTVNGATLKESLYNDNQELGSITVEAIGIGVTSDITWSPTKTSGVAYYEDGVIHFNKAGTVTVTASGKDSNNKAVKASFKITIVSYTQSITVTSKTGVYEVVAGKSLNMVAKLNPAKPTNSKVTWSVDPDETYGATYATISSSGVLKANKVTSQKTVTVRCASQDGCAEAVREVTIYPAVTSVGIYNSESVSVASKTVDFEDGMVLDLVNYPSQSMQKWTIKSSNTSLINPEKTITGGNSLILNLKAGATVKKATKVTITVTSADGSNKSAKFTVTVPPTNS